MEVGRNGDQHDVDAAVDQFLVTVETREAMGVVDDHLLGIHFFEPFAAVRQMVGEQIGHGDHPHVLAGVHGVGGRTAAASAATDQAELDHVAARGMYATGQR